MNEEKWIKLMSYAMDLDAELASRLQQAKDQVFPQEEGDTDADTLKCLEFALETLRKIK